MNADLERTLEEMGGEYRAVVDRLVSSPSPDWRAVRPPSALRLWMASHGGFAVVRLAAASILVVFALALVLALGGATGGDGAAKPCAASASAAPRPYLVAFSVPDSAAVGEILGSQRPDGSWGSDYLTRQNAAALRSVDSAAVAYRRAVRYLRARGLVPLTDAELNEARSRASEA
jgi:hypothetical protein